MIQDPVLDQFVREVLRPLADRLKPMMPLLDQIPHQAEAMGIAERLGTTHAAMFRAQEWAPSDYVAMGPDEQIESAGAYPVPATRYRVAQMLRLVAALGAMRSANPSIDVLLAALAVNPQLFNR